MGIHRYDLDDRKWEKIKPLLPGKQGDVGRSAHDNRLFVNAVLFIANSGVPWRDLPERYGKWNSVYQRFNRLSKRGIWQAIFDKLRENDEPDWDWVMLDSTSVRVHQHGTGQKKQATANRRRMLASDEVVGG